MPILRCTKDGKAGYKYGNEGTCYTGPNAKEKAIRQAIAISKDVGEGIHLAESYNDYPKGARENAQRVLRWIDEYGRDVVSAGTRVGLARANQIAKGENLTLETLKRIKAFFDRHIENREIKPEYKGKPYLDKGYASWLMWGGDPMYTYVKSKIKQIENEN